MVSPWPLSTSNMKTGPGTGNAIRCSKRDSSGTSLLRRGGSCGGTAYDSMALLQFALQIVTFLPNVFKLKVCSHDDVPGPLHGQCHRDVSDLRLSPTWQRTACRSHQAIRFRVHWRVTQIPSFQIQVTLQFQVADARDRLRQALRRLLTPTRTRSPAILPSVNMPRM